MKISTFKIKNRNKGYAIVEFLFYISILAILILVVINSMLVMTRSFRETTVHAELVSASSVMERMSREIRQASNISSIGNGNLILNTTDEFGASKTVQFLLSGSDINFLEDSVSLGNLNTPNITISSLSFTEISTTKGQAVKVFLTLSSSNDILNRSIDFYNTVALRGSY